MADKATERAVLHLLRDIASYYHPFGGSEGFVDVGAMGQYGPAGFIEEGMAFLPRDARRMKQSMEDVLKATAGLRKTDFAAWKSLVEPYLGDPGDPSLVDHWRKLAAEARERRKRILCGDCKKELRQAGIELPPSTVEKTLEDHARAISKIAEYLKDRDLYYVEPKRMSTEQEKKMEDQNAAILALYERHRRGGLKQNEAARQTAEDFGVGVTVDSVERLVEFRHHVKKPECAVEECERAPYSQGLCQRHYQEDYRNRKKKGKRKV